MRFPKVWPFGAAPKSERGQTWSRKAAKLQSPNFEIIITDINNQCMLINTRVH